MNPPWLSKNGQKAQDILYPQHSNYDGLLGDDELRDAAIRWLLGTGVVELDPPRNHVAVYTLSWRPKEAFGHGTDSEGKTLDHALIRLVLSVDQELQK